MEESGTLPRVGEDKKSSTGQRAATSAAARRTAARCPPTTGARRGDVVHGDGSDTDGNEAAREKNLEKELEDLRQEAGESSQRHTSEKEGMVRLAQEVRSHTHSSLAPTSVTLCLAHPAAGAAT